MTPNPPINYSVTLDEPCTAVLAWEWPAGVVQIVHEISYNNGQSWGWLDHDELPTVTSTHSLNQNATALIRAKAVTAVRVGPHDTAGEESAYTTPQTITTGGYEI